MTETKIKVLVAEDEAHLGQILEAEFVSAVSAVPHTLLLHAKFLPTQPL